MFLLDAAGNIIIEFISSIPTHLIDNITIIAIDTANKLSINFTFIPLLFASIGFMLIAFSLLNSFVQNISTSTNAITKYIISDVDIFNMSPTK